MPIHIVRLLINNNKYVVSFYFVVIKCVNYNKYLKLQKVFKPILNWIFKFFEVSIKKIAMHFCRFIRLISSPHICHSSTFASSSKVGTNGSPINHVNAFSLRTHNCGELRLTDVGQCFKIFISLTSKFINFVR
jgi:hypothetical protein